jgi:hypothetical protein
VSLSVWGQTFTGAFLVMLLLNGMDTAWYSAIHHAYATGQQDFSNGTVTEFVQRLHDFDVLNTSTGFSPAGASHVNQDKSASAAG